MERKQDAKLELVATRVPTDVRDSFREVAASEHRSVAAELRRMIEQRVAESVELQEAA